MKTFFAFMRENRGMLLFSLASPLIMLCVFLLYRLDSEPYLYGCALYLLAWLCVWLVKYRLFFARQEARRDALSAVLSGDTRFPEPHGSGEADYIRALEDMSRQIRRLTDERTLEKSDMQDYYTLWVHQIKTPIAAMRMLMQTDSSADSLEAELFRIEQYADMALQYQRLENMTGDLAFREYPLDGIIRACIRKYAPLFIAKKLTFRYSGTSAHALTDEKWLSFILEQLLSNAVKYTHSGSVSIKVTEENDIVISDTGIGILPEDLPRIFEKGFTGQNGRLDHKATGLGLYLCSLAAEKLDIALSARSAPGEGSAFTLSFRNSRDLSDVT